MGKFADDFGVFLLPREKFPLVLEAFTESDGKVVWTEVVTEPRGLALVRVPGLKERYGGPIGVRVRYGDGTVESRLAG